MERTATTDIDDRTRADYLRRIENAGYAIVYANDEAVIYKRETPMNRAGEEFLAVRYFDTLDNLRVQHNGWDMDLGMTIDQQRLRAVWETSQGFIGYSEGAGELVRIGNVVGTQMFEIDDDEAYYYVANGDFIGGTRLVVDTDGPLSPREANRQEMKRLKSDPNYVPGFVAEQPDPRPNTTYYDPSGDDDDDEPSLSEKMKSELGDAIDSIPGEVPDRAVKIHSIDQADADQTRDPEKVAEWRERYKKAVHKNEADDSDESDNPDYGLPDDAPDILHEAAERVPTTDAREQFNASSDPTLEEIAEDMRGKRGWRERMYDAIDSNSVIAPFEAVFQVTLDGVETVGETIGDMMKGDADVLLFIFILLSTMGAAITFSEPLNYLVLTAGCFVLWMMVDTL